MTASHFPSDELLIEYISKKLHKYHHRYSYNNLHIQKTCLGNRNSIYYVTANDEKQLVFKGYRKKNRLKNSLISSRFLARNNINVPRILFSDTSQKTFNRFGFYCTCEEKIPAVSIADCRITAEHISSIAAFYAGLHSLRSSRWGKIISMRKYGILNTYDRNIKKRLRALHSSHWLTDDEKDTCLEWFNGAREQVKCVKYYSLCHGDVNKKNILISSTSGSVYMIDNEAVRYQPYVLEYYRLYYTLCENNPDLQKRFVDHYMAACSPGRLHELTTCGGFFSSYVLLELAAYHNRKIRSGDTETADYYTQNTSRAVHELKKTVLS